MFVLQLVVGFCFCCWLSCSIRFPNQARRQTFFSPCYSHSSLYPFLLMSVTQMAAPRECRTITPVRLCETGDFILDCMCTWVGIFFNLSKSRIRVRQAWMWMLYLNNVVLTGWYNGSGCFCTTRMWMLNYYDRRHGGILIPFKTAVNNNW